MKPSRRLLASTHPFRSRADAVAAAASEPTSEESQESLRMGSDTLFETRLLSVFPVSSAMSLSSVYELNESRLALAGGGDGPSASRETPTGESDSFDASCVGDLIILPSILGPLFGVQPGTNNFIISARDDP